MKINFFKKEKSFKKKKFPLNPNFYWKLGIILTFISVFLSFFFGYRLFMQINQEPILSFANNNSLVEVINKVRIIKVLDYFSEREEKSTEILNFPSSIIDPSL